MNAAWREDVKAELNGLPSGGQFDSNIRSTDQYKQYLNLKRSIQSVYGGDIELAKALVHRPTFEAFQAWRGANLSQNPATTTFTLVELWKVMGESDNIEIVKGALKLYQAYEWLVAHRE